MEQSLPAAIAKAIPHQYILPRVRESKTKMLILIAPPINSARSNPVILTNVETGPARDTTNVSNVINRNIKE